MTPVTSPASFCSSTVTSVSKKYSAPSFSAASLQYSAISVMRDTSSRPQTGVGFLVLRFWMVVAQDLNPPRSKG